MQEINGKKSEIIIVLTDTCYNVLINTYQGGYMNTKLTLTLDNKIIAKAKTYAMKKHKSLSRLVENYFRIITEQPAEKEVTTPLVRKLSGAIRLKEGQDDAEEYSQYLIKKYK